MSNTISNNKKYEIASQNVNDIDIQAKFQTQSIYNTQQTLNLRDYNKFQNMEDNINEIIEENIHEEQQHEYNKQNTNSHTIEVTALKKSQVNNNIQQNFQNPLTQQKQRQSQQQQKQIMMNNNNNYIQSQDEKENIKPNQQNEKQNIIKDQYQQQQEISQKDDQNNQNLLSQEIYDNEQLLSANRQPLSPINQSIDIQQGYNSNENTNLKNEYENKQILLNNQNKLSLFNKMYEEEGNSEEQQRVQIKGTNSISGQQQQQLEQYQKEDMIISQQNSKQQQNTQQQQIQSSFNSTQRVKMQKYEKYYFNMIMTQYNMCISVLVILMNTFTFGIFWGLFFYEFRSARYLKDIKEDNNFFFIVSSMSHIDYADFFIYYRLIIDLFLFALVLATVFGIPRQNLEIAKLFFFYVNFVLTVFCFVRMEKYLYYDDVLQLKQVIQKYEQYQVTNIDSFKNSFENYYFMLKMYNYSIVISVIVQMFCFVYYSPDQNKIDQYEQQQQQQQQIELQGGQFGENQQQNSNLINNNGINNQSKQSQYILPNMLNSTVQLQNGVFQFNIHPQWKSEIPQNINNYVE